MFDHLFLARVLDFGPKGQKFDDFYQNQPVTLGISGGMDSVFLLHLLHELRNIGKIRDLRLLHVNYGLRGEESDGDAQFVAELSKQYEVPLQLHVVSAEQREARQGKGIQEWARDLRRGYFAQEIAQGHIVALGHHQDDLLETMIFRAVRGSSTLRLGGMQAYDQGVWRPLLGFWREDLARLQTRHKLPYREDSSNAKITYDRNFVRHQILQPLTHRFPGAKDKLLQLCEDLTDLSTWALDSIKEDLDSALQEATLPLSRLIRLPQVLQRLLVAEFLQRRLGQTGQEESLINREIVTQVLWASHAKNAHDRAKFVHLGREHSVHIGKEGIRLVATDPRKQERMWQWARARLPIDLRAFLGPGVKQDWEVQALEGIGEGTGWIHMENLSDQGIQINLYQPYREAEQKIRKRVKKTMQMHGANLEQRARWMVLTLNEQRELLCDGNDFYDGDSGAKIPRDALGLRIRY